MPCLLALLALLVPRVVIAGAWLLTDWFAGVFETMLWPLLGFIFAPVTLLWYSVVMNVYGGTWDTLQLVGLAVAVLIDASPSTAKKKG